MAAICVDRGFRTYDVVDSTGEPRGSIRFNPSDPGLKTRMQDAVESIQAASQAPCKTAEEIRQLDATIKAQFDYVYAAPVSEVLFGGLSSLAICEDGQSVAEHVLTATMGIISDALKEAAERQQERVQRHTRAYLDDPSRGTAPEEK